VFGTILAGIFGIIGILFLIAAAISNGKEKSGGYGLAAIFILLSLSILGFKSFFYVSATEVAVPITFGNVGSSIGPGGMHTKAPWTSIETLPVRPFTLPEDISVSARTSQGGNVTAVYGGRWQVDKDEAGKVYLQVRTGDEEKISKDLVEKSLGTAVGNVYVGYDNAQATTARVDAEQKVLTEVNRLLDPYGVSVTQVFLRRVDPDEKTRDSLNRLSAAKNETLIAAQKVLTAEAEAKAAAAVAQWVKDATDKIPANLTQQQVTLYCAQLWADAQQQASAKGQTLWTTPCGSGAGATPLVSAK